MFALLYMLFVLGVLASRASSRSLNEASILEKHAQWMAHYGCVYIDAQEKIKRSEIFKKNVEYIESFNRANNKPYKLGINGFADLTNEEFKYWQNRFKSHVCSPTMTDFKHENVTAVPSTMEYWRKKGAVTPIKDQCQCG